MWPASPQSQSNHTVFVVLERIAGSLQVALINSPRIDTK